MYVESIERYVEIKIILKIKEDNTTTIFEYSKWNYKKIIVTDNRAFKTSTKTEKQNHPIHTCLSLTSDDTYDLRRSGGVVEQGQD